ncbi:hypothetical protein CHS0354_001712 [Potamilus streckersoni]|uniref:Nuclear condensin complex subunit 3 C-terminal domain-containing protein n=1 Tax=Potamilus streckersoni TaxID=2493646 RepID=A0AAE0VMZ8_9BIVA|nr:hypothetical protein CHS0354_001712 [Potamilus streckersoni]
MKEQLSMKDIFDECQNGLNCHSKMLKNLQKVYDKMEFEAFWLEFSHYLKYPMVVYKREAAVERVVDFITKFATSIKKNDGDCDGEKENETRDEVEGNILLIELFDFLLKHHSARERAVRFRCCQMVNKLLSSLGEHAQIDDKLYERLYECMLERLKDKCPNVRLQAIQAMSRLQDPTDENCPVIKAYLFLLNCDPNSDVRKAVLSCIAPSTKTLPAIIGRTHDLNDTVRKMAYLVLSEKVHIKALSIALRLQLMNDGLNDRAETVRATCSSKLLPVWLRTFGGNILELLGSLDVEDSTNVCSLMLEHFFKATPPAELVEKFDLLDDRLLIPPEKLSSESSLYWQAVCRHLHKHGTSGEEYLEKVLPNCVQFCSYLKEYVCGLKNCDDIELTLSREFIIQQLLQIGSFMDLADMASRKAVEEVLHWMLMSDHVSHRLVKDIIQRICEVKGRTEVMVSYFAETVSEIREPITVIEAETDAQWKRQIDVQIAGVRVKLNQFREELDECVRKQEFARAGEIKVQVSKLEAERAELLDAAEPKTQEIRTEKNDPPTVLKCQKMIAEMLEELSLSSMNPTLQTLMETQVIPGIQNEDADVRNMAMRSLGICCQLDKDLIGTYLPLFMQASKIDVQGVRITALQVLFDLLHSFGLDIIQDQEENQSEETLNQSSVNTTSVLEDENQLKKDDDRSALASKLVAIICSFLDSESPELRTVAAEGLAKLLLSGRLVSAKILSHLILLWYNPLTEDDSYLRDCLGTFFPIYAFAGRDSQEIVEEAFIPTLKKLLNAPASSPLAEVDVNNVAELLIQLTNVKLLAQNQERVVDNPGHDNLAVRVCNEILSNPSSFNLKLWVRILNQLDLSPDNDTILNYLDVLCDEMLDVVKEKQCAKALEKFQAFIKKMQSREDTVQTSNPEAQTQAGKTAIAESSGKLNSTISSQEIETSESQDTEIDSIATETVSTMTDSQLTERDLLETEPQVSETDSQDTHMDSKTTEIFSQETAVAEMNSQPMETDNSQEVSDKTHISESSASQSPNSSQDFQDTGTVITTGTDFTEDILTMAETSNVRSAPRRSTRTAKSTKVASRSSAAASPSKKTRKAVDMLDDSDLENSIFVTPTPGRVTRSSKTRSAIGTTRKNLDSILKEEEKPVKDTEDEPKGRTTRTRSNRALRSKQE